MNRNVITKEIGNKGEEYAVRYLKKHRYKILARNYSKRVGEIDIIAEKNDRVVFVEVKTRHEASLTQPFEAVDKRKQQRIIKTAFFYIQENRPDCNYRFDICEVFIDKTTLKQTRLNYYKNAFSYDAGDGYY